MSKTTPRSSIPTTDLESGFLLDRRWRIRPDINRVFDGDTEHQVPDKFMQVLVVLIQSPGVVSRQELFDTVWPDTYVVDESLTRAISSLRKLFDDDPKHPRVIETIPKKGYRLLVPVEPLVSTGDQATAGADTPHPNLDRPSNTSRWWPVIFAAVIAAISVAGWWAVLNRETRPEVEPVRTQITALPGIEEYPALSPAGDRIAFVWGGNDEEPDGVFVQVIGAGPALRLTDTDGHYAFPAWTHDSRFIAFARLAGATRGIFMVPAAGGAEIELVAAEDEALLTAPTFSPDGRWLVFAERQAPGTEWRLRRTDLGSGQTDTLAPSADIPFGGYRPRFSPDGAQLAFLRVDTDGRTIAITTIDGSAPTIPVLGDRTVLDYDWTSDSNRLIVNGAGEIAIVATDGALVQTVTTTQNIGALSVARSRQLLAYSLGRREKNIWRWTPASGPAGDNSQRIVHTTAWDAFPVLAPDGQRIAFLSDRTGTPTLWIAARDGSDAHMAADLDGVRWSPPAWSPDGNRIALTVEVDGIPATCLVEVVGGRAEILATSDTGETFPIWSIDRTALYVIRDTPEGGGIWRRQHDEPTAEATAIIRDGAYRVAEAPDGSALYFTRSRRATEIWRCDADGGNPTVVFTLETGEILSWRIAGDALVVGFRREIGARRYPIVSLDLTSGTTTELLTVPGRLGFDLDVDPIDGRSLVFDQTETVDSDVFAIEGY